MRNNTFNGDKLKSARIYRGLSVAELAEKVGIQRQTISLYENNKINVPSMPIIENISDVLNFPSTYFFEDNIFTVKKGSTYFRSLLKTTKKYRNQQLQRIEYLSLIYEFLEEYIDFPELNLPLSTYNPNNNEEIEKAADDLRKLWGLGNYPISNLVYHAEKNGIIIVEFDSEDDCIDAYSQMVDIRSETKYFIGYSKNKNTASRIHFDIAHELGHILLHEWSEDIDSLSKEEFKQCERQAHRFASAFLLPKETFLKDLNLFPDKLDYYKELKKKWKVSMSAMIRRAYDLDVIDNNTYSNLMRLMQKRGIKKKEPLDDILVTSKPTLIKTVINLLFEEKIFTPTEFINELSSCYGLSMYHRDLEEILSLDPDALKDQSVISFDDIRLKDRFS